MRIIFVKHTVLAAFGLLLVAPLLLADTCVAATAVAGRSVQDDKKAAVKGRVVVPARWQSKFDVTEIPLELITQVVIADPEFPPNWAELNAEQREAWWVEFEQSEAGQKYFNDAQQTIDNAPRFPIRIEPDGRFVVFDIPPAVYSLRGMLLKKLNDQQYAAELYGELTVQPNVDEVMLGDLELALIPIIEPGQTAPDFDLLATDNTRIQRSNFANKHFLISFWAAGSPPAAQFHKRVLETVPIVREKQPLELVSVSMDSDLETVAQYSAENGSLGPIALSGGWQSDVVQRYGVRGIPSIWLVSPDGKVLMTSSQFGLVLQNTEMSLAEIIQARIAGKTVEEMVPVKD